MRKEHHSSPRLGLSAQERVIVDALVASEKPTVGAAEVLNVQAMSSGAANQVLARLARKGWLVRVKRGLYAPVRLGAPTPEASIEDAWSVAMSLFAPCYIAGWSAAEHWNLTEQIFESTAVVTARSLRQRETHVAGLKFVCRTVDPKAIFGTATIWSGSNRVDVADPHRLVVDVMGVPSLGGGARHAIDIVRAYLASDQVDLDKVLEYGERLGRGVVFKRLGFVVETYGKPSATWIDRCRAATSEGVSLLDPEGAKRGKIVSRWKLRINVPIEGT